MTTTLRLIAATAATAAILATTAATAQIAAAADDTPKGETVPFETLAIVSGTTGINLGDRHLLRLTGSDDVDPVGELLAHGSDPTLAAEVVSAIDEVPSGAAVLVGIIDTSCTPADRAGLVRLDTGELQMFAPGHVPEPIECFVANDTVAVLEVDADDAPPGSADGAQLVHFGHVGALNQGDASAVELTDDADAVATILPADTRPPDLPHLAPGTRRLAFVRPGCQQDTAELWVTRTIVTPQLEHDDPDLVVNCAVAEYFLAVFDIAAADVPPNAELDGSIVG